MLVSAKKQSESALCIHISPPSWVSAPIPPPIPPFWVITEHWAELPALYSSFPLALYSTQDLNDQDNYDGVVTHLESDILECEVKWALGSITRHKVSGGDGIPVISNPKRWCCESAALNMLTNSEYSAVTIRLEKISFYSNTKEGQYQRMFKLPHNCTLFIC